MLFMLTPVLTKHSYQSKMSVQFCRGNSGVCDTCGAPYTGGWQNCPSPRNRNSKTRVTFISPPQATPVPKEPSLAKKAWDYCKAVAAWKLAGSPRRSEEEVQRIFAICQACEHFIDEGRPHCGICGCGCGEGSNPMTNKIAMATEVCPDDPPRWT